MTGYRSFRNGNSGNDFDPREVYINGYQFLWYNTLTHESRLNITSVWDIITITETCEK